MLPTKTALKTNVLKCCQWKCTGNRKRSPSALFILPIGFKYPTKSNPLLRPPVQPSFSSSLLFSTSLKDSNSQAPEKQKKKFISASWVQSLPLFLCLPYTGEQNSPVLAQPTAAHLIVPQFLPPGSWRQPRAVLCSRSLTVQLQLLLPSSSTHFVPRWISSLSSSDEDPPAAIPFILQLTCKQGSLAPHSPPLDSPALQGRAVQ